MADRAGIERDLVVLNEELKAARRLDATNRISIVRHKIDRKLDEWSRCDDPASVASETEFGAMGTAPE